MNFILILVLLLLACETVAECNLDPLTHDSDMDKVRSCKQTNPEFNFSRCFNPNSFSCELLGDANPESDFSRCFNPNSFRCESLGGDFSYGLQKRLLEVESEQRSLSAEIHNLRNTVKSISKRLKKTWLLGLQLFGVAIGSGSVKAVAVWGLVLCLLDVLLPVEMANALYT